MTSAGADAVSALPVLSELADVRFAADPSFAYRAAHASPGPGIFRMPNGDGLIITGHKALSELKGHPSLGAQNRAQRRAGSGGAGALARVDLNSPFFMNEPVHAPIALATFRPMSPARSHDLSVVLRDIAVDAIAQIIETQQTIDLASDYAFVIARDFWVRFLGLPDAAAAEIAKCSAAIVPMLQFVTSAEEVAAANEAASTLWKLLDEHHASIKDSHGESLFHKLAPAIDACDLPGAPESVAASIAALTFDGVHSVAGTTANVLYTILRHPGQLALLRDDHTLIHAAWREAVRLEPSFIGLHRSALADIEYDGVLIPRGINIVMAWGAANRDPRVFDNPDRFEFRRPNREVLSFGGGPRICKGRHLAMLEGEIALRVLLENARSIELLPQSPDWGQPGLMRAIRRVPVRITLQ